MKQFFDIDPVHQQCNLVASLSSAQRAAEEGHPWD
jgi:hypothetical protein